MVCSAISDANRDLRLIGFFNEYHEGNRIDLAKAQIARAGLVVIVPSNVRHSVKALTDGWAIMFDYPLLFGLQRPRCGMS